MCEKVTGLREEIKKSRRLRVKESASGAGRSPDTQPQTQSSFHTLMLL